LSSPSRKSKQQQEEYQQKWDNDPSRAQDSHPDRQSTQGLSRHQ
jgi:hypothetical protein